MEKRERGEHRGETNHGRKRRETIEAGEKNGAKEKGGMRQAREGERQDRKEKESGERQERRWEKQGGRKQNNCGMA